MGEGLSVTGDLTVSGNMTISGTTTTLETTNSVISDKLIELAKVHQEHHQVTLVLLLKEVVLIIHL